MIITKQSSWAGARISPWTSRVSPHRLHSQGALSTHVMMSSRTADFLWAVTMETKILHMGARECNLPEVEDGTSCVTLSDISCPSCQCVLAAALLDLCLLPPPNLVLLSLDAETSL